MFDFPRATIKIVAYALKGAEPITMRFDDIHHANIPWLCKKFERGSQLVLLCNGFSCPLAPDARSALQIVRHVLDLHILVIDGHGLGWKAQWEKYPIIGDWIIANPNLLETFSGKSVADTITAHSEQLRATSLAFDRAVGIEA